MNAQDYLALHGIKKAREVAQKSGTSYAYFWQIAKGIRRPSVDLAERLVEASGHEMDFVSLLRVEKKKSA